MNIQEHKTQSIIVKLWRWLVSADDTSLTGMPVGSHWFPVFCPHSDFSSEAGPIGLSILTFRKTINKTLTVDDKFAKTNKIAYKSLLDLKLSNTNPGADRGIQSGGHVVFTFPLCLGSRPFHADWRMVLTFLKGIRPKDDHSPIYSYIKNCSDFRWEIISRTEFCGFGGHVRPAPPPLLWIRLHESQ